MIWFETDVLGNVVLSEGWSGDCDMYGSNERYTVC